MNDLLVAQMEDLKARFASSELEIQKLKKEAEAIELESANITEEQKRMQGEYRALLKIGQSVGVFDQHGNCVNITEINSD